jgi:hypothetical protein
MKAIMNIKFVSDESLVADREIVLDIDSPPDSEGIERVIQNMQVEFKVPFVSTRNPEHNSKILEWLNFSGGPHDGVKMLDVINSQELWREITNTLLGVEHDLILAEAYKACEPLQEPPWEDDRAINNLYYVHSRKMDLVDQVSHGLKKVQALVDRLLLKVWAVI